MSQQQDLHSLFIWAKKDNKAFIDSDAATHKTPSPKTSSKRK